MIHKENIKDLLVTLGFEVEKNVYSKHFPQGDFYLKADFNKNELMYPEDKGFIINERQTCNFASDENFVVFECVHRLLMKGYKPQHIELEPKWKVGHGASGGRADILVKNQQNKPLLIIECKTAGKEFDKAWKDTQIDGGQLFSYIEQEKDTEFVCLYASDFDEKTNTYNDFQRIISHKDNEKILADDTKLKSFKDAKNVKDRYKVWKETYQLEYTEKGIFEENIQAYQIGKDKYTLDIDTKSIDNKDIKGRYHQFRTILRKYNVSRRENAFEVLVNLFLCKIVDEIENPNDLKFYWKGIAYDNYFDLVDRLQELYKIGMDKFLHQDIVYISNKEIDDAFWAIKQKRNATKQSIKEMFRRLKFYKGLDFEFIKVHNKENFDKNAKVLLEILQMWQGLRLKTKEQNQFLGDMFEYFLDNGIKQSEGQFFTPVPICKFIVMSLPLEHQIKQTNEALNVSDYACGSGHFLTEYALQVKPLVKQYKQAEPSEYYKSIYGIEKEDRLAKVAKVSAFMYGRDEINVLDADALAANPVIKDGSFHVLIANPPFAVEDFLMTLDEEDRDKYELFNNASDLGNKNIQCFFLERAKQLMAVNGVVGIIVPSSILSNSDSMHIATREILLKYFDFVSIVELGSNTFGKTGTQTVVLFLRRKAQRPEPADHFWNRTLDFFENWEEENKSGGGAYLDIHTVKNYCQHIDIDFNEYQTLLKAAPSAALLETEMFKDYKSDFDNSNEIKKLKEAKQFKAKTKAEQKTELEKRFLTYLQKIEQQKLYYYMLAQNNPQKVLIVKSPSDNKKQQQFLGYEWSGSKGSEGIKYNGGDTIHDIITPMFDPKQRGNAQKINYYIQQNFQGIPITISNELQAFMTEAYVEDLLDFSRKDFNKALSLTVKKDITVKSKWELVKLENIMTISRGASPRPISKFITNDYSGVNWVKIGDVKEGEKYVIKTEEKITQEGANLSRLVKEGDFILSNSMSFGRPYIMKIEGCVHDGWLLLTNFIDDLDKNFLYEILSSEITQQQFTANAAGGVVQNLNTERVKSVKIPLPPLSVQQKIVSECEAIDIAVENAKKAIVEARAGIEEKVKDMFGKYEKKKISEIACINPSKTEIKNVDENTLVSFIEMASVSNEGYIAEKVDKPLKDLKKGSYTYFAENDIIIAKITP
ncbi:MAG: restriction endonuclease subunit S [Candidatus Kapaibacterium sp.]